MSARIIWANPILDDERCHATMNVAQRLETNKADTKQIGEPMPAGDNLQPRTHLENFFPPWTENISPTSCFALV
jgi:hypothetical protein